MSTYLALVNRLKLEAGVSGPDLTTLVGVTGEMQRLASWIAASWTDIQAQREDWKWLRRSTAFPTTRGHVLYTTAECNATNFCLWSRDTFRNYLNPPFTVTIASPGVVTLAGHGLAVNDTFVPFTSGALPTGLTAGTTYYVLTVPDADTLTLSATAGGAAINTTGSQSGTHTASSTNVLSFVGFRSEIQMDYIDYDVWRDKYLLGNLRFSYTRPIEMSIAPDKSIVTGPIADAGYTLVGDFFRDPVELSADTDTPAMPNQFHLAIVYQAMMSYGAFEAAPEVYNRGEKEFGKIMRRIGNNQLPEMAFAGALA